MGDFASAFGCLVGLQDHVTAITFVALGTSLPDLFASRTAAIREQYADNAIGNVTGSNAFNVFLGIYINNWYFINCETNLKSLSKTNSRAPKRRTRTSMDCSKYLPLLESHYVCGSVRKLRRQCLILYYLITHLYGNTRYQKKFFYFWIRRIGWTAKICYYYFHFADWVVVSLHRLIY